MATPHNDNGRVYVLPSSVVILLTHISVSLLPVMAFLGLLVFMDSYKLVGIRSILFTILVGGAAAGISLLINSSILSTFDLSAESFRRYVAPVVEESAKAAYLLLLLRSARVGFMVDAAIYGFAIGTGFALVENVYFLHALTHESILRWIVRGFGTAIVHGSTMAILGIISKNLVDRKGALRPALILPGLMAALLIHSIYNHFILPPLLATSILLIVLPLLVIVVFDRSERATRRWLGASFDSDIEMLELITSGEIGDSRIGQYLSSLKSRFPGQVVGDMLCLLRIHSELAVRAKGILMAREAGFELSIDEQVAAQLDEMKYLTRSIGKTGQIAIHPFIHGGTQDLWQLRILTQR